ncbi:MULTISPECIES: type I-F CRISPR-associated protein Csy3 [unclassified Pseudomonas]|uniref:type I-F CRISPR-associated protein Csy3 n=1 Tax=unclassified Pseudomonas TaxID=196821 RepID=UPI0021C6BD88|nr:MULTISPECIES: type I-F CRISPR-associated protein Csy3 [unclassified Pseudomonas]MCU1730786.1 type I-F CRISPR-associated protein Csy3 [Pseudomonas sp. 20P_3.2_Bac4]MCU1743355.1 type I-F CRISPR-associated protein Csy3 [Pseudomonas sp. 20P_3.2_Bac5]
MSNDSLKTASVLAFERKLDPSDAVFHAGDWQTRDAWTAIAIREKSVRGTISNRLKTKDLDPAKLDAAIENPNLQTVDVATLPHDADTLRVSFTLRVLGGTGQPSACNDADYRRKLLATVKSYVETNGFNELARRYAYNLANGRFLWRNRIGAEQVEVQVEHLTNGQAAKSWTFDGLALSLRNFDNAGNQTTALDDLGQLIANGLVGEQHVLLRVTAYVRLGAGQEVFPSQELILDRGRGDKSKTLYDINGIAGIHAQKIGNAIRSIDTWYSEAEVNGPIAVEPYGSVTTQGKAYRQPRQTKDDFYTLLDGWVLKDKVPEIGQQHFVIATLIRGGVFGEAG